MNAKHGFLFGISKAAGRFTPNSVNVNFSAIHNNVFSGMPSNHNTNNFEVEDKET